MIYKFYLIQDFNLSILVLNETAGYVGIHANVPTEFRFEGDKSSYIAKCWDQHFWIIFDTTVSHKNQVAKIDKENNEAWCDL